MKILTVCYEFPPVGGGGGNMARNIAGGLARRGHELKVQTVRIKGLKKIEFTGGVEIRRSFGFRRRADFCTVPEMAGYLAGAMLPGWRLTAAWRPDVIHAHFAVPSGVLAWALHVLTGVPYVLTVHLGDLPGGNPDQTDHLFKFLNPLIRPIWRRAAGVTASSEFAADLARKAYGVDPEIIHNGISMSGRPDKVRMPGDVLRFVSIGRFNPQKNFPWMIRALSRCRFEWTLDLVGDGAQADEIRAAIRETGLTEKVRWRGWLPEETMRETLAASDIMLMPSTSEGNPVAALEALKQGVAIVGSTTPGLSDLIVDGVNGYAVPVEHSDSFVEKLTSLASDRARLVEMKANSLKLSEQFDIDTIAADFEGFLGKAIRSRS